MRSDHDTRRETGDGGAMSIFMTYGGAAGADKTLQAIAKLISINNSVDAEGNTTIETSWQSIGDEGILEELDMAFAAAAVSRVGGQRSRPTQQPPKLALRQRPRRLAGRREAGGGNVHDPPCGRGYHRQGVQLIRGTGLQHGASFQHHEPRCWHHGRPQGQVL